MLSPEKIYNLARIKEIPGLAIFSPDRKYRYLLTREWSTGNKLINFLMCNPSIADEKILDPTVAKCLWYAIYWGYDKLAVTNIFAYKSTDIKQLDTVIDPIGPENDFYIQSVFEQCKSSSNRIMIACGNKGLFLDRYKTILDLAKGTKVDLDCLSMTKLKMPSHPLYLSKEILTNPKKWLCWSGHYD